MFHTIKTILLALGIVCFASSPTRAEFDSASEEPKLCDFARLQTERNFPTSELESPYIRARLAAIDWVRYHHIANITNSRIPGLKKLQEKESDLAAQTGFQLMDNLDGEHRKRHLHSCFAKAFESSEIYLEYFSGMNFSRSQSTASNIYAVVEPKNSRDPIFIVTPEASFNYFVQTNKLEAFDAKSGEFYPVEPRARRWIERVLQVHFAQVNGK